MGFFSRMFHGNDDDEILLHSALNLHEIAASHGAELDPDEVLDIARRVKPGSTNYYLTSTDGTQTMLGRITIVRTRK